MEGETWPHYLPKLHFGKYVARYGLLLADKIGKYVARFGLLLADKIGKYVARLSVLVCLLVCLFVPNAFVVVR